MEVAPFVPLRAMQAEGWSVSLWVGLAAVGRRMHECSGPLHLPSCVIGVLARSSVGATGPMEYVRGVQHQGDAMDHDPKTCTICLRTERMKFDTVSNFHFVPHDSKAAFPLFRLYPAVPESV